MDASIIVAIITVISNIVIACISYTANRKGAKEASETNARLIAYRLEQLEKKQDKHNETIERTFKLEGRMTEVEHEIRDLKGVVLK